MYALNDSPQSDWVVTETGASVETANVGKVFIIRGSERGVKILGKRTTSKGRCARS